MTIIDQGAPAIRRLGHLLVAGDDDRLDLDVAARLPEEPDQTTVPLVERTSSVDAVVGMLRTGLPSEIRSIRCDSSGTSTSGLVQRLAESRTSTAHASSGSP